MSESENRKLRLEELHLQKYLLMGQQYDRELQLVQLTDSLSCQSLGVIKLLTVGITCGRQEQLCAWLKQRPALPVSSG